MGSEGDLDAVRKHSKYVLFGMSLMAVASLSVLCELDFFFGGVGEGSSSERENVGTIKPGVVVPKAPRGGCKTAETPHFVLDVRSEQRAHSLTATVSHPPVPPRTPPSQKKNLRTFLCGRWRRFKVSPQLCSN